MREFHLFAVVICAAVIASIFLGRYEVVVGPQYQTVRLDRWTGAVLFCAGTICSQLQPPIEIPPVSGSVGK